MNTHVTFSLRQLVLAGFVALALIVAYLLGGRGTPAAAATVSTTGAAPRTITLAGRGSVPAVPDELSFAVSVSHTDTDTAAALDSTDHTLRAVLARLKELGVQRRDTASTNLAVEPTYRWTGSQDVISGYRATQTMRVTVRDLSAVGKVLSGAVAAGGNDTRVSGIQLQVADPEAYQAKARAAAVADAHDKAEAYARATGQELGEVLQITERAGTTAPTPTPLAARAGSAFGAKALASVPVRAGRQPVKASITVVWALR